MSRPAIPPSPVPPLITLTTVEGTSFSTLPTSKNTSTMLSITESIILEMKSRLSPESSELLASGELPSPNEPNTATAVGIEEARM